MKKNNIPNFFDEINFKILWIVPIVIIIAIFLRNIYTVQTGEAAIILRFGKLSRVDKEGLHYKLPFIDTKTFIETREVTYSFENTPKYDNRLEVSTKDMQSVKIDLTVQASIQDAEILYRAFKDTYVTRLIIPRVKEIVQSTISKYTIEEFISKRTEISNIINKDIADDFLKYGIVVSNVSIVNHDFSDEYEKAIESKKVAEQAVEKAKAEQAKLLIEKENKVKLAELELKERELKAEANKIESATLTPQLLKKMAIEKWDGKLPKVSSDKNSNLINID